MIKKKDISKKTLYLLAVIFVILGFLFCQGFVFFKFKIENDRLNSLKNEYDSLIMEIDSYKQLKVQYEIILNNSNSLNSNKKSLEDKVNTLNEDINNIEGKIVDISKKIKNLS